MSDILIKEFFLFPHYKIIVFEGFDSDYSMGGNGVSHSGGRYAETTFSNKRMGIGNKTHKMLGNLSVIDNKKCKVAFDEARYSEEKYPDFNNPDGNKLDSPLDSIKSHLQAEGWTAPEKRTWIIIPKPSKKLNGSHVDIEFNICKEDFDRHKHQNILLPVYMTKIKSDIKEIQFSVEIPNFLYDFLMNHPDLDKRPKSKVITSATFSYLHTTLSNLSNDATALVAFDKEITGAKRVILIEFNSRQIDTKDDFNFGYTGKRTTILFNYFLGYDMGSNPMNNKFGIWVDKKWEAGKGFTKTRGRMAYVGNTSSCKTIGWTQEREDFLCTLEEKFKILSETLNKFLGDMNADKLDYLLQNQFKVLQLSSPAEVKE